jgi:hypothetical protein
MLQRKNSCVMRECVSLDKPFQAWNHSVRYHRASINNIELKAFTLSTRLTNKSCHIGANEGANTARIKENHYNKTCM